LVPPASAADLKGAPGFLAEAAGDGPGLWTGIYAGLSAGYGAGDSEAQEINGPRNYIADFDGAIGSAHIGWQKQFGHFVGGVEFDVGYMGLGSSITREVTGGSVTSGADFGAYAALSARMGVLLHSTLLVYGRAGVAVADVDASTVQTCADASLCGGAQTTPISEAKVESPAWGLLLGAGLERHLSRHWSARLEYQFIGFREELALPEIDGPGWNHDMDVHAVSAGLSYRF
jgi:outer membrane immunogenic protein